MNGPQDNGSQSTKYIFVVLVWIVILSSIFLGLKYSGVLEEIGNEIKQGKLANLTSNKSQNTLTGAGDAYDGYSIIRSSQFKANLRKNNLNVNFVDDNADYPSRVKKLVAGDYDFAVMPIHDYLEQLYHLGIDVDKAPVIIGAVSLSNKSDAVLYHPDNFNSINDLKELKRLNSCYTSKFMIGSMAVDTGLPILLKGQANEDINQTFNDLISGKCKVAGLWEPYISMAKSKGFKVFMDSSELKLARIIDVFIVNRETLLDKPEIISGMLLNYYEAADYYTNNITDLYTEIESLENSRDSIEIAENLSGVKFYSLSDNVYTLFKANSTSAEKILDYIDAIVIKLIKMNAIGESPLPNGDSRSIVYNKTLKSVFNSYPDGEVSKPPKEQKVYNKLQEQTWKKLVRNPKFTRDDLKITFMRNGKLDNKGKSILDNFASGQIENFDYYLAIVGKTAKITGINEQELTRRTKLKSDQVEKYLVKYYQIDSNRIKSIGAGSTMTKPKKAGESYRNYINDNNTVEIMFIDYK